MCPSGSIPATCAAALPWRPLLPRPATSWWCSAPTRRTCALADAAADLPPQLQALLPRLHAILHGERNPALADDPGLTYHDTAELQLLSEEVGKVQGERKA